MAGNVPLPEKSADDAKRCAEGEHQRVAQTAQTLRVGTIASSATSKDTRLRAEALNAALQLPMEARPPKGNTRCGRASRTTSANRGALKDAYSSRRQHDACKQNR